MKHILMIVENLPVPFDRRVWQEASALREAGYRVSVICPATNRFPKRKETINGIRIYRHPLYEAESKWEYFIEYPMALLFQLLLAIHIWCFDRFDVIHGCNPPDLIWIIAAFFLPLNVAYVFDHHDINPELYETKFGRDSILYKILCFLEYMNFQTAHRSIATNQSYKTLAVERGGMTPEYVNIVRSAPDLKTFDRLRESASPPSNNNRINIGYVGVMGEQEGIDLLLKAVKIIQENRSDVCFTLVGDGPAREDLETKAREIGVSNRVEFTGRVSDKELVSRLMGTDICVNPDRATPMNDKSTMNKILEYMALEKPIVQFDLTEGRYSARNASLYATNNDPASLANKILKLVDNPEKRKKMGKLGRKRLEETLNWEKQKQSLIELYDSLTDEWY